jgi:hypothetical protein
MGADVIFPVFCEGEEAFPKEREGLCSKRYVTSAQRRNCMHVKFFWKISNSNRALVENNVNILRNEINHLVMFNFIRVYR